VQSTRTRLLTKSGNSAPDGSMSEMAMFQQLTFKAFPNPLALIDLRMHRSPPYGSDGMLKDPSCPSKNHPSLSPHQNRAASPRKPLLSRCSLVYGDT
jgi:hypothetical protein